ncbi:MAG TPA: FHA domain-containing protein [Candidatus Ruania gallistercoris]|uniref:FHA domain-containing protein n=1 Tax=Candidatus Ruania gallistercoris TaxID=2838746 RepID=A0A9D2ED70_9MICO|nr:FHA domain-containing protein [Candidatus Ruania gallistercoris]
MLDLIGDEASGYLSAPAERSRWQDTWTMQRTRREALALLARTYGSWARTLAGALASALLLGGSVVLGLGVTALADDGDLVAVLLMVAAVLLLLAGLAGGGYVLFTGTRVVGALRAWSAARAADGGPGLAVLFTPAVVVRLVLAAVLLVGAVTLVLVRTGALSIETAEQAGDALSQWLAAAVAAGSAAAAVSGAVRTALALRRRPGTPVSGWQAQHGSPAASGGAPAAQQWAPEQWAPQPAGPTTTEHGPGYPGPGADTSAPAAEPGAGEGTAESAEEEWAATRMVSDLQPAPAPLQARSADGQVVTAEGVTLVGRSPQGRPGEQIAALLALTDTAVSKTHLALRLAEGRIWVTDRASTNGTVLLRDGGTESLTPWQETPLAPGDRLLVGATTMDIEHVDQA